MSPLPTELQKAIEQGELTADQLRELIRLEAQDLGLSVDQAIQQAKEGKLPKSHIGSDLELLIDLLPIAA